MTRTNEFPRLSRQQTGARGSGPALRTLVPAAFFGVLAVLGSGAGSLPARAQATLPTGFRDSLVVGGLSMPIGMAFLPDGRLLVVEQNTHDIKLVRNGVASTVFTVPGVSASGQERGLLGIAVDPGWPTRPYVYLHLDELGTETIRITRYTVAGDLTNTAAGTLTIDGNTRRDILTGVPDQFDNHNGGTVRFGTDGMLYASFGDDAQRCVAQDQLTLRGVIVRLDVSGVASGGGPEPSRASIAAAGNPLIGAADDRAKLIWSWGLRNPFRFTVDSGTGDLFIGDVGENNWEEIDRAASGGLNFGWSRFEAAANMDVPDCVLTSAHTLPVYAYGRTDGVVVIPAVVYRLPGGAACRNCLPASYAGDLFVSDYYSGFLRRLSGGGNTWSLAAAVPGQPDADNWATGMDLVSDYGIGPDGGLWYCHQGVGQIRAILAVADTDTTTPPPPPPPGPAFNFRNPYPQPASGSVSLSFTLPQSARVRLRIYDLRGALVRTLVNADRAAGARLEVWDGTGDDGERVPSGLYVARLEANGESAERRMMLVR